MHESIAESNEPSSLTRLSPTQATEGIEIAMATRGDDTTTEMRHVITALDLEDTMTITDEPDAVELTIEAVQSEIVGTGTTGDLMMMIGDERDTV